MQNTGLLGKLKKFVKAKIAACIPSIPEQNTSVSQVCLLSNYHLMKHLLPPEKLPKLSSTGFQVYSQFEEDGLLLYIFSIIGTHNKRVLEICAGNGMQCMAANLIINHGWEGLLFDGSVMNVQAGRNFFSSHPRTWLQPPIFVSAWITRDNVNELVRENGFTGEIDLLSLDIDGNDYWIWDALNAVSPRVLICETQNAVPADVAVTQPYNKDYCMSSEEYDKRCFSASLAAMKKLSERKGYRLIGGHRLGFNAIFMRNDIGMEFFPEVCVQDVLNNPYSRTICQEKWPAAQHWHWTKI